MKKLFVLMLVMACFGLSMAQNTEAIVKKAAYFAKSKPISELPIVIAGEDEPKSKKEKLNIFPEMQPQGIDVIDAVVQKNNGGIKTRGPIRSIPGQDGGYPPDTQGDVSPDHYIQVVNVKLKIWDKAGNTVYGPVNISTFWNDLTGPWTGTNDGDPIVLWDEMANRWILTQFVVYAGNGKYYQLFAVSETSNPLGTWAQYAFEFDNFNDYPKFGIWSDAYVGTYNMFNNHNDAEFMGTGLTLFDRQKMIEGDPDAEMVYFPPTHVYLSGKYSSQPADADNAPPAGAEPVVAYLKKSGSQRIEFLKPNVNWNNPQNSTLTLDQTLNVSAFSTYLQGSSQPGTSLRLDQLQNMMMYRLNYRNFSTHESMVFNHTVNVNGRAGIRWYELRRSNGGDWQLHQESTYSPDDANRWMGSMAINENGDIALGYSVSNSSDIYPSIRYTGRRADDPNGQMTIEETELITGAGSQTNIQRWGDYSCMSVDPTDGTTFWYTQEYMRGQNDHSTHINSFDFEPVSGPSCVAGQDTAVCFTEFYTTSGTATAAKSILWTTSGDGRFVDENALQTKYLRGSEDMANGGATLILSVEGFIPGTSAIDSLRLSINQNPVADAGKDTTVCKGESVMLNGSVEFSNNFVWTTSGDGSFDDVASLNAIYTPGENDIINESVDLQLTANPLTGCTDIHEDAVSIGIFDCTGINELNDIQSMLIAPNPTEGVFRFTLETEKSMTLKVQLSDMAGKTIFKGDLQMSNSTYTNTLDITALPNGIYYLTVQAGNSTKTQKIIKR